MEVSDFISVESVTMKCIMRDYAGLLNWNNFLLMWLALLFLKSRLSYSYYANYSHQQQGQRFQDRFCNASWSSCLRKCTNQNFKRCLPGNLISLAGSKIIHTNTMIVFAQAVSVAKVFLLIQLSNELCHHLLQILECSYREPRAGKSSYVKVRLKILSKAIILWPNLTKGTQLQQHKRIQRHQE